MSYATLMGNFKRGLEQLLRTNEKRLYGIDMYWNHNRLNGQIPQEIGNLSALARVY